MQKEITKETKMNRQKMDITSVLAEMAQRFYEQGITPSFSQFDKDLYVYYSIITEKDLRARSGVCMPTDKQDAFRRVRTAITHLKEACAYFDEPAYTV